jgi:hypothetical protein
MFPEEIYGQQEVADLADWFQRQLLSSTHRGSGQYQPQVKLF